MTSHEPRRSSLVLLDLPPGIVWGSGMKAQLQQRLAGRTPVDVDALTEEDLVRCIDHTLLRPELTRSDLDEAIRIATTYRTATLCVRPTDLAIAVAGLRGSVVGPSAVVGFPHGAHTTQTKIREAVASAELGAVELDMVSNIGWLRSGYEHLVEEEIEAIVLAVAPVAVKVILETAYLTDEQVELGCRIAASSGAAFVKNATGFSPRGATVDEIERMRRVVGPTVGVKAAGGIRSLETAMAMLGAGANRFGCTVTAAIVEEWRAAHSGV